MRDYNTLQEAATHCNTHVRSLYDCMRGPSSDQTDTDTHRHKFRDIDTDTNTDTDADQEVGGWGRDPKKYTGRDWGMGSSTI